MMIVSANLILAISAVTGLVTQAVKKILDELGVSYKANLLAGIVSVIVSVVVYGGYIVAVGVSAKLIVSGIGIVLISWLVAMLGYDKVVQTLSQIGDEKNDI